MTEREMKQRKAAARRARQRKARNRRVLTTVALMLVVCIASIGGTIAWLTDQSETVKNTFSPTDISIKLEELSQDATDVDVTNSFDLVPGKAYSKNPKVTVVKGNEECWLFVKMIEAGEPGDYITYAFNTGTGTTELDHWNVLTATTEEPFAKALATGETVYYRKVSATEKTATGDQSWNLLTNAANDTEMSDGSIVIKDTVTKENMTAAAASSISFEAYAIQTHSFATAMSAWNELNPADGSGN